MFLCRVSWARDLDSTLLGLPICGAEDTLAVHVGRGVVELLLADSGKIQLMRLTDMFLNWVYRRTTGGDFIGDPCIAPLTGSWEGFLNINHLGVTYEGKPGNIRYEWIDDQLYVIFATNANWR